MILRNPAIPASPRRAFTLLEVLLAIALVMLLAGAIGAFIFNLLDRRATLLGVGRDVHAASALIDRIEGDLLAAIAGDAVAGAGVDGTGDRLRILTRGVWIEAGSGMGAVGGRGGRGGDLQRSEYRFDAASARVTASRGPAAGADGGEPAPQVVSDRVERLRFRYFDGREWLEAFNSLEKGDLPVAVEVAVWLAPAGVPPRTVGASFSEDLFGGPGTEEFGSAGFDGDGEMPRGRTEERWRRPDRLRIIVVPDGPVTAWRER